MKCKNIRKLLVEYSENMLKPKTSEKVYEHLYICADCSKLYDRMMTTVGNFESTKQISYQSFFYTRIKQRLENRKSQVYTSPSISFVKYALFSLIISTVIIMGIIIGNNLKDSYNETEYIEEYAKSQYIDGTELVSVESAWFSEVNN